MKGTEFLLGILGLNRVERMTVASVCSLTHSRPRGYTVLPQDRSGDADIMLVDADDAVACSSWEQSPVRISGKPALMISRDPSIISDQPYALPRTNFASRLVKILDQITIREFKFLPDMVVSDTNVFDAGLGMTPRAATGVPKDLPRALVVDDSVVVRTKMRTLLELHGLHADLAEDAEQGLAFMRVNRYAIVFLDVVLPGMDGYAACRQMKANDKNAPPIIMLTGRDSPFDKIRGVMAGCNRYLTKPIAVDALHKVLREFAAQHVAA
jgi:two-component system, cell cycle response regulator